MKARGVFRGIVATAIVVVAAHVSTTPALAAEPGSRVFVLEEVGAALPRGNMAGARSGAHVVTVQLGAVGRLAAEMQRELADIETLGEREVFEQAPLIEARVRALSERYAVPMSKANTDAMIGGEITSRFDVTALPAVLEMRRSGSYRKIELPTSLGAAMRALAEQPFLEAPPPLTPRAVNTEAARRPDGAPTREELSAARSTARELLGAEETSYSLLDAFFDASSPASHDCLRLRVTGICMYLVTRIYCGPTGCSVSVTPEASIELTHFNPDFLVAPHLRLGASPIQESQLLFGRLQNELTAAVHRVVTGREVPPDYFNTERWAGAGSEGGSPFKSTMKYHEVDVIGHPGHVYSMIESGSPNPLPRIRERLREIPVNVARGIADQLVELPGELTRSAEDVEAGEDEVTDIPGYEEHPGLSLHAVADLKFIAPLAETGRMLLDAADSISDIGTAWSGVAEGDLTTLLADFEEALASLAPDAFSEAIEVVDQVASLQETFSGVPGIDARRIDLFSFCPSDADVMTPYLTSGTNRLQWGWNIPELADIRTYAFAITHPDLFIGDPPLNSWGGIFPRMGYVQQADPMRAAMVASFRGGHVVTRDDQKHVYSPVGKRRTRYLKVTHPPPLEPRVEESGIWQIVAPAKSVTEQCFILGEDDPVSNPLRRLLPWTGEKVSDDGSYVTALWREYTCCPEPRKAGAVSMTVVDLPTIPLDIEIVGE